MIHCRRATGDDLPFLIEGNQSIASETENVHLSEATLRLGIQAIIEDIHKGIYWVAVNDQRVVGQILVTYEWSDWRNGQIWWIQSVYVWPKVRRQGVFRALLAYVT